MFKRETCPYCRTRYTKKFKESVEKARRENISKTHRENKENGLASGRPRAFNYDEIYRLRDEGLSIQKIADRIGSSRGSVCNALKVRG